MIIIMDKAVTTVWDVEPKVQALEASRGIKPASITCNDLTMRNVKQQDEH